MARRLLLIALLTLGLAPAAAPAAEPRSGTVSATATTTQWRGVLVAGYPSYATIVLGDAEGANAADPCVAPSCDSFRLKVETGGGDLTIKAASPDTEIVTVRVSGP